MSTLQFSNEAFLVDSFVAHLMTESSPWELDAHATEFNYQAGRTDVIAATVEGLVFAVEAKLVKWRQALHQAFRNTSFAHKSYVLLPPKIASSAQRYEHEFLRRNVGLLTLGQDRIEVLLESNCRKPRLAWLTDRAIEEVYLGVKKGDEQPNGSGKRVLRES